MKTRGIIRCTSKNDFFNIIAALVERGLTYEADFDTLTITTTGGY